MSGSPGALPAGVSRGQLLEAVRAGLAGLAEGARAVVALSGGPDSTALAYLVAEARPDLGLTLVHVRHGLRDDTEDLAVVHMHADWLGLPLEIREVEVVRRGEGLEAAARHVRYAALREVAAEVGADALLVGHTADDQAETMLLRLARGTGVDGLVAMRPHAGDLLRPLLRVRRPDVHRFVLLEGLPSVRDPHNLAPAVRRSVARHRVLPALEAMGPDPVGALTRLADLAGDDAAAIAPLVAEVVGGARRVGQVVALRTRSLTEAPVAVARRALREVLAEVGEGPPPSAAAISRVLALGPGGGLDLPGAVRVTSAGGWLALAPAGSVRQEPGELVAGDVLAWDPAAVGLRWLAPGAEGAAGEGGPDGQIALELTGAWSPPAVEVPDTLVPPGGDVGAATLVLPEEVERVMVRHRRPGDRLRLPAGTRRLKDLYVDAGVPRPVRARWPVVVDEEDQLLWVPGVAADLQLVRRARRRPAGLLALAVPPAGATGAAGGTGAAAGDSGASAGGTGAAGLP